MYNYLENSADIKASKYPEYGWLAMDWDEYEEVWLFSRRPSDCGIKSGSWDITNLGLCGKVMDGPPSWVRPGQLWERMSYTDVKTESVPNEWNEARWDGHWWHKVEDHGERSHKRAEDTVNNSAQRGTILDKAKAVINGERQDQYGSPEDSFALIAEYWDTYLTSTVKGKVRTLDVKDVAVMMVLFKLARQANQHKEDNLIDAAGYLGILGDMEES